MNAYHRTLLWTGLGVLVGVLLFAFRPSVRALPEYMTRTGEACATCHVNPAGGGTLTERGSLWVSQGKPDKVPLLPVANEPASAATGGAQPADPLAAGLYGELACDACHGEAGEGASGPALNGSELSDDELRRIIRDGRDAMPGYATDKLSDSDLSALVGYIRSMTHVKAPAESGGRPALMEPVSTTCGSGPDGGPLQACDGN